MVLDVEPVHERLAGGGDLNRMRQLLGTVR
jgi:hypothetical protein